MGPWIVLKKHWKNIREEQISASNVIVPFLTNTLLPEQFNSIIYTYASAACSTLLYLPSHPALALFTGKSFSEIPFVPNG
jgi:hypothetical protein